jgi:hypothetical protein
MSRNNIRQQINYCKKEITRLNKEYKEKKKSSKKELEKIFITEINELESRVRALSRNVNKTSNQEVDRKERKMMIKKIKKEIRAKEKEKSKRLKQTLTLIKKDKRDQIKKIKDEIRAIQTTVHTMRKPKNIPKYINF